MDITNTFHFSWGEMTVTLLDFHLLMGLFFFGDDLPMMSELSVGEFLSFFGLTKEKFASFLISLTVMVGALTDCLVFPVVLA